MRPPHISFLILWLFPCLIVLNARASGTWTSLLDHGKVRGFPSYDQAVSLLDSWLTKYPNFIERHPIGQSIQGRTIYAYYLCNRGERLISQRPQALITSLIHAREPASLTVTLYFMGHLLEQQEKGDPEAVYLLQMREIWVVPLVNPDGYIANENLQHKVIRKNMRRTCKESLQESTLIEQSGVDLNRNFGFHWEARYDPCQEEYQGSAPFSEPETQALKGLVEAHKFKTAVNFHTYGGMLTHPFNYGAKALTTDDQVIYDEIADIFKWQKFGTAIQTVGYTTTGEEDDWLYATHGVISMSPEVGPESGGFWPQAYLVAGIDERNYARLTYVTKKAGLELHASWTHQSATQEQVKSSPGYPQQQFQTDGWLAPTSLLHLRLRNAGLSKSSGEFLNVAVSGGMLGNVQTMSSSSVAVVHAHAVIPEAATCPEKYPICGADRDCVINDAKQPWYPATTPQTDPGAGGYNYINGYNGLGANCAGNYVQAGQHLKKAAQLVVDAKNATAPPILTFQIAPLERRSTTALQIFLAQQLEAKWPKEYVNLCAVEMPAQIPTRAAAVCQCVGPASLSAPPLVSSLASSPSTQSVLVNYAPNGAVSDLQKLCNAAVAVSAPALESPVIQPVKLAEDFSLEGDFTKHQIFPASVCFFTVAASFMAVFFAAQGCRRRARGIAFEAACLQEEMMPALAGVDHEDSELDSVHTFYKV